MSVPRIKFSPCTPLLQHIHTINPLQPCSDIGVAFFYRVIRAVGQHLDIQCGQCVLFVCTSTAVMKCNVCSHAICSNSLTHVHN